MKSQDSLFITLEGGEGSGKSTLARKLTETLTSLGYDVISTREPGGTKLGNQVRYWLLNRESDVSLGSISELLLFLAARAQHIEELIKPSLELGKIVICDRFNDSTIAYQGIARGLGAEIVEKQCLFACQGVLPQLTLFLDLDPRIGLERTKKLSKDSAKDGAMDRIEGEELVFHDSVREGLRWIAKNSPDRVHLIDANQTFEEVYRQSLDFILYALNK